MTTGEYDTGLDQLGGMGIELRVQLRAAYPGAEPEGSLLVRERHPLPPSARTEMDDFYLRVAQRTDGALLAAFDTHGIIDLENEQAAPTPSILAFS